MSHNRHESHEYIYFVPTLLTYLFILIYLQLHLLTNINIKKALLTFQPRLITDNIKQYQLNVHLCNNYNLWFSTVI